VEICLVEAAAHRKHLEKEHDAHPSRPHRV
jgi:hypothetical protein